MRVDPFRFNDYIKFLSEQDEPENAVLFYGSSTFTFWGRERIKEQISSFPIINHGFGGSTAEDALFFYHIMVKPYKPSALVWYEGDNDIVAGYSPDETFYISKKVFEWARLDFPNIPIFIVPIKHCPSRDEYRPLQKEYNNNMEAYANSSANTFYIDIDDLLYKDNVLRQDIFMPDNLHFNDLGYIELSAIVKKSLEENLK